MHVSVVSMSFLIRAYDTGIWKFDANFRTLHTYSDAYNPARAAREARAVYP